jgi:phage/plasmid-associated DNA primase
MCDRGCLEQERQRQEHDPETVADVFGSYAVRTPAETLMVKKGDPGIPSDVARLQEVRLALADEITQSRCVDEAKIKNLTGIRRLVRRILSQEFFEFDA